MGRSAIDRLAAVVRCRRGGAEPWSSRRCADVVGRWPKAETPNAAIPTVDTIQRKQRWYPRATSPVGAKLGLVGIVRNEAPYLLEWIAHHRVLGFDRIVIYDNNSNDASWRILQRLAKAGEIDAVYWHVRPHVHKQASAYNHALARLRDGLGMVPVRRSRRVPHA